MPEPSRGQQRAQVVVKGSREGFSKDRSDHGTAGLVGLEIMLGNVLRF